MAAPMDICVAVRKEDAQNVRKKLETSGIFDGSRKIQVLSSGEAILPVKSCFSEEINSILLTLKYRVLDAPLPPSRKQQHISPQNRLRSAISQFVDEEQFDSELDRDIPTRWEKHGDLILLPANSFGSPKWKDIQEKVHQQSCENQGRPCLMFSCFWRLVAEALGGRRLARKGTIQDDPYRSPRVQLLLGDHGWVEHTDNGIRYSFDATKCMFSRGNITEKLRMARMDCEGETVVDLYAGIGYFTLPFLVHGKAAEVHACEWNPAAVEALQRNLQLNNVQQRCTIQHGDNRVVCPRGVADRVNLGLIPSSRDGWPVACAALKPNSGGILHIHENVTSLPKKDAGYHKNSAASSSETMAIAELSSLQQDTNQHTCNSSKIKSHSSNSHSSLCTGKCSCKKGEEVSSVLSGNGNMSKRENKNPRYCDKYNHDCHKASHFRGNEAVTTGSRDFSSSSDSGATIQTVRKNGCPKDNMQKNDSLCFTTSQDKSHQRNKMQQIDDDRRTDPSSNTMSIREEWNRWAYEVANSVQHLLLEVQGGPWQTKVLHIEHVKSYAPHVDHLVVDLECRPLRSS